MKRLCTAALVEEEGSRSAQLLAVLRHELPFVGPSAGRLLDNEPFRGEALVALADADSASSATDDGDVHSAPVSCCVWLSFLCYCSSVFPEVPVIYHHEYTVRSICFHWLRFQQSLFTYSYIPFDVTYVMIIYRQLAKSFFHDVF